VCEAKRAVKALCFQSAVTQHLEDLCVLLTVFLEDELSLLVVVLVLSCRQSVSLVCSKVERMELRLTSSSIFATFSLVLRHIESVETLDLL
jgi:hypothetical protein